MYKHLLPWNFSSVSESFMRSLQSVERDGHRVRDTNTEGAAWCLNKSRTGAFLTIAVTWTLWCSNLNHVTSGKKSTTAQLGTCTSNNKHVYSYAMSILLTWKIAAKNTYAMSIFLTRKIAANKGNVLGHLAAHALGLASGENKGKLISKQLRVQI